MPHPFAFIAVKPGLYVNPISIVSMGTFALPAGTTPDVQQEMVAGVEVITPEGHFRISGVPTAQKALDAVLEGLKKAGLKLLQFKDINGFSQLYVNPAHLVAITAYPGQNGLDGQTEAYLMGQRLGPDLDTNVMAQVQAQLKAGGDFVQLPLADHGHRQNGTVLVRRTAVLSLEAAHHPGETILGLARCVPLWHGLHVSQPLAEVVKAFSNQA
ncbi:hypothetical protein E3E12_04005 [Formicincola oecophyllae]|uniref:Uncharacterized protein n=1 Tax=Formicincola oecophyllae TaxID=2558361 RepID=A0A4Y6U7V1_9PROT|nr:hypothetical protein [Formicincola oecophyllae]QDH13499.1 hypothetical protein E3E12_04005 [Formicincola oecophyllae]